MVNLNYGTLATPILLTTAFYVLVFLSSVTSTGPIGLHVPLCTINDLSVTSNGSLTKFSPRYEFHCGLNESSMFL